MNAPGWCDCQPGLFFTSCTLFLHLRLAAGSNFVYDADARLALHQRTEGFV